MMKMMKTGGFVLLGHTLGFLEESRILGEIKV